MGSRGRGRPRCRTLNSGRSRPAPGSGKAKIFTKFPMLHLLRAGVTPAWNRPPDLRARWAIRPWLDASLPAHPRARQHQRPRVGRRRRHALTVLSNPHDLPPPPPMPPPNWPPKWNPVPVPGISKSSRAIEPIPTFPVRVSHLPREPLGWLSSLLGTRRRPARASHRPVKTVSITPLSGPGAQRHHTAVVLSRAPQHDLTFTKWQVTPLPRQVATAASPVERIPLLGDLRKCEVGLAHHDPGPTTLQETSRATQRHLIAIPHRSRVSGFCRSSTAQTRKLRCPAPDRPGRPTPCPDWPKKAPP